MKLTKEKALELHRQMWSDMQKVFGDKPSWINRISYKRQWIKDHCPELAEGKNDYVYEEIIRNNCFLCEYAGEEFENCVCPIKWPHGKCETYVDESDDWRYMPISRLLALPEREVEE